MRNASFTRFGASTGKAKFDRTNIDRGRKRSIPLLVRAVMAVARRKMKTNQAALAGCFQVLSKNRWPSKMVVPDAATMGVAKMANRTNLETSGRGFQEERAS
jgi:hypothetical protein